MTTLARKNWQAIAACPNEQLRYSLIAASGDIAEGLAAGFPQYFLAEGEEHPAVSRTEFVAMVRAMRRDDAVRACKDAGLPYALLQFSGSCEGRTDGVSYAKGGYNTTANGWAQKFWRTSQDPGKTLEYEGAEWVVCRNGFGAGDARFFDTHSLLLVPVEAFAASAAG